MRPLSVIEADPVVNDPFGLEAVGDFMEINGLLLQGTPEPFDEDVVEIAPAPIFYRQCIGKANVTRGIDILISALVSVVIQPVPVYWLP